MNEYLHIYKKTDSQSASQPLQSKKKPERPKYKESEVTLPANVGMGEETNSYRSVDTRMLDRFTRLLLIPEIKELNNVKKVKPKEKFAIETPHIAAVKLGNDIHIAGNSGNKYVRPLHTQEGNKRILEIVDAGSKGATWGMDITQKNIIAKEIWVKHVDH